MPKARSKNSKSLVIVESPAKSKTINKFLGPDYIIKASMGHIKDLPLKELGVDVKNEFKPKFVVIANKKKVVKDIKEAAKKAKDIYIATDPDREGEAIAYHISTELSNLSASCEIKRVAFNEITKNAIKAAFENARSIDMKMVEAQNARRVLDRLVGYKLSPLLWKKVKSGLSAGRVQSIAVRILCEREEEIKKFISEEYWSITADLEGGNPPPFSAKIERRKDLPAKEKLKIGNEAQACEIVSELKNSSFIVSDVKKKDKTRAPSPPFITSTMQQEASRRIGFTAIRTMRIAQGLYEGIALGSEGHIGLITYMRTDSVRVADEAQSAARSYIEKKFGRGYLPEKPPFYKSRKGAQDAHEAIRPTDLSKDPESIRQYLSEDQCRLYKLIYERFLASQMKPAVMDVTVINVEAGQYLFVAEGSIIKDKGFLIVSEAGKQDARRQTRSQDKEEDTEDDEETEEDKKEQALPDVKKGERLNVRDILKKQNFTKPLPRYTDASLVKALEEKGIGRPSTYAPIIYTIQQRGYVAKDKKKFYPTELGTVVNDMLVKNFPNIMNIEFTAHMEEELDDVGDGKIPWVNVVKDFYEPFYENLAKAQENVEKVKREAKPTGEACPTCGSPIVEREGRFGKFFACSGYPQCKYTKSTPLNVLCPECGGEVVTRRTKKRKTFYGCSNYPKCKFMSWSLPEQKKTPEPEQDMQK